MGFVRAAKWRPQSLSSHRGIEPFQAARSNSVIHSTQLGALTVNFMEQVMPRCLDDVLIIAILVQEDGQHNRAFSRSQISLDGNQLSSISVCHCGRVDCFRQGQGDHQGTANCGEPDCCSLWKMLRNLSMVRETENER